VAHHRTKILIPLRGNARIAWRAVLAWRVVADIYCVETKGAPGGERWAFQPGDFVRCAARRLPSGERVLAAVRRIGEA
jgi:hypothetical protein